MTLPASTRRALILTAAVGDGHLAAARALAEDFGRSSPDVEVTVADALAIFGPVLRFLLLDAYRLQLRRAPWVFGLLFGVFLRVRALRALGRAGLATLGARSLERFVREQRADLVVSTYPAATSVLGYLRRRGRIDATACATITDLGAVCFWADRGIDLHLVMHEGLVAEVERVAGAGSARVTRPLVGSSFFEPVDAASIRRELEIPDGRIIVVSGGGWGVGDLIGAMRAVLAIDGTYAIAVAGRNEAVERDLKAEFAANTRARVFGFTTRMNELLAAADALVHTTGGVTCLESFVRNCPVVSYGARAGHVPTVSRTMQSLGIARHARSRRELQRALADTLASKSSARPFGSRSAPSPGAVLMGAQPRLPVARPVRRKRRRLALAFTIAIVCGAYAASSDAAYGLLASELELAPSTTIQTRRPDVGLIVEAPSTAFESLARTIARAGDRASFAFLVPPPSLTQRLLLRRGDTLMPNLTTAGFFGWLDTADHVQDAEASVREMHVAYCLAPSAGLTAGQYLLARAAGVTVVAGSLNLSAESRLPRTIGRGAIVVLHLDRSRAATRLLETVLANLHREGLSATSLAA